MLKLWKNYCKLGGTFFSTFGAISVAIAVNILTVLCFDNEDISFVWLLLVVSWFFITFFSFKIATLLKSSEADFHKIRDTDSVISSWVFNNTKENMNKFHVLSFFFLIIINLISMMLFWLLSKYDLIIG